MHSVVLAVDRCPSISLYMSQCMVYCIVTAEDII